MPGRMRGVKEYNRRQIGQMGVDTLLDVAERLKERIDRGWDRVMHENQRAAMINSLYAVWDRIFKVLGIEAAMMSDEAAKTALEEFGSLFRKARTCPKCGHEWGEEKDQSPACSTEP